MALFNEILGAYFDWQYFTADFVAMLQFIPRIVGVIMFAFLLNNISRWSSLAFACSLHVFVLFQLMEGYQLRMSQLDQLWRMESTGAVRNSKIKEAVGVISILRKHCIMEINELNFDFLFPLVVMHAASACNLPFAFVQVTEERAFYCSLFLVDVGCLVAISIDFIDC